MKEWICTIVGTRPDGSFTWRRVEASEPRGTLTAECAPPFADVGSRVRIRAERDWSGRWHAIACENTDATTAANTNGQAAIALASKATGQLRWCNIMNPLENACATGKPRPAVLITDLGQRWRVMGLTTKDHYETGQPRTPIPDFANVGLHGPGFVWGHRLTAIRTEDVGALIGDADVGLVEAILDVAKLDLTEEERCALRTLIEDR